MGRHLSGPYRAPVLWEPCSITARFWSWHERRHRAPTARRRATVAGLAALALLAGCSSSHPRSGTSVPPTRQTSLSTRPPTTAATPTTWTGYHADGARTGAVRSSATFDHARTAWSDDLGGAVRGQVLVAGGRVIAATENNRVVALDPADGAVVWSVSIGRPLTDVAAVAGCGNIDPLGITSTPVVDPATGVVYVVGEVSDGHGGVTHRLVGLSVATGAVVLREDVDPPLPAGERPTTLLQRAALALANGRVYVAYGGNDGDCGTYNGWVVGVAESGPPQHGQLPRSPPTATAARSGCPVARRPSTRPATST